MRIDARTLEDGNEHGCVGRLFVEPTHSPDPGRILFDDPIVALALRLADRLQRDMAA
jgi:hypothetical protein